MAGGVGSRFWPLSTQENPKQFIDILGVGETLIQSTFRRFSQFIRPENISTNIWCRSSPLWIQASRSHRLCQACFGLATKTLLCRAQRCSNFRQVSIFNIFLDIYTRVSAPFETKRNAFGRTEGVQHDRTTTSGRSLNLNATFSWRDSWFCELWSCALVLPSW